MRPHDRNQSSANFSRLCLKSKLNASSSHDSTKNSEKISKYFTSPTKSEGNHSTGMDMTTSNDEYKEQNLEECLQSTSTECPYKNSLTEINNVNINTSINEGRDFKTPKRVFKRNLEKPKLPNPANNARGRKTKTRKDTKTYEQMILTKTLSKTDVNVEHLQLAIALSRSLQENHKCESEENEANISSPTSILYPSTQQKVATIKQTLEQFGLRKHTNQIDVQHRRKPVKKKNKKSRYQYITPVLLLRTEEDRKKLINEKVTLILSQTLQENVRYSSYKSQQREEPVSEKLKKHWSNDNRIFELHNFEMDTRKNNDTFYVKSLNIPPTITKCGSFLKDWAKIAGREKSPLRKHVNENLNINVEDNNQTNIVSNQCSTKENTLIRSSVVNSDFTNSATDNDILSKTFKNNLKIRSFSNGSISPELFESDDDVLEIPEKNSQLETLICLDEEHSSQSPLNLTPQKSKSVKIKASVHLSPNKVVGNGENSNSESLLSFSPTKKNKAYTKNTSTSSDMSDDDLFINDNGICTFERFSNDHIICLDLTHSSDEENNEVSEEKNVSFDNAHANINQSLRNISPIVSTSIQCSLSTGISEIMQKSMYFPEENLNISNDEDIPKTTRRSKSLNITDYICNMLNEEQVSISNSEQGELGPEQNRETDKNSICDLTQTSMGSSCSNDSSSAMDQKNYNSITKASRKKVSESDNTLSPLKSDINNSISKFEKHDSFQSTASDLTQGSQESICISDEELNYCSLYGTPCIEEKQNSIYENNYWCEVLDDNNLDDNNIKEAKNSNYDNIILNFTPKTSKETLNNKFDVQEDIQILDNCEMVVDSPMQFSTTTNNNFDQNQLTVQHPRIKNLRSANTFTGIKSRKSLFNGANLLDDSFNVALEDPHLFDEVPGPSNTHKQVNSENQTLKPDETSTTPEGKMVIKTTNVTPMNNYNAMDTPKITKELQKFGLKPLKRQRGIEILKHIYESTHPIVGQTTQNCEKPESDDEGHRVIKRVKSNSKIKGKRKSQTSRKRKSPKVKKFSNEDENVETELGMDYVNITHKSSEEKIEIVGDLMGENETVNDLIFERKHSTKVPSCRVPLHIAWYNLVSSQPELRKNILLYEPLQLEVLYKLLKEQGYKYHIQDLLTFLDKKCITIRTNQNQHQTSRQQRKSISPQKNK